MYLIHTYPHTYTHIHTHTHTYTHMYIYTYFFCGWGDVYVCVCCMYACWRGCRHGMI